VWRDDRLPVTGVASVETRDADVDGKPRHSGGVLSDAREVDVRQAREVIIVVPDDRDVRRDVDAARMMAPSRPTAQRSLNATIAVGRESAMSTAIVAAAAPDSSVSPPGTIRACAARPCRCIAVRQPRRRSSSRCMPNDRGPGAGVARWRGIARYAFGEYDAYNLWEAPDNVSMAAVAVAISGGGALSKFETTVLLTVEETMEAMQRARDIAYRAPGA
jgi:hypothetical protein